MGGEETSSGPIVPAFLLLADPANVTFHNNVNC